MAQIACRGIRGATTSDANDRESIVDATKELLEVIVEQNNLEQDELNLFNRMYNIMFSTVKKPDLLIYLHADVKKLQENIKKRGREYEQNISNNYLKKIEEKYFDYLKKQNDFPVLMLDISKENFIEDEKIYNQIITEIQEFEEDVRIKSLILG